jgi:adenine-specific DNA-methyltransferase
VREFANTNSKVFWGDCFSVLGQVIPDSSVDLIFADPPYNIGKKFASFKDSWPSDEKYAEWCHVWIEMCVKKLKPTGSMYVMTSTQCMPYLDLYIRRYLTVLSRIVWHYDSSGVQAKNKFGSMYEPILHCVADTERYTFNGDAVRVEARTGAQRRLIDYRKPNPTQYNTTKIPGNVWYFPRVRYRMLEYESHPSQKPEALLERIILASSNPGDVVLDPFAGTFTTSAVAQRLERRSIGIEQEGEYIKIGLRRLGICQDLDGEELKPLDKTYERKNGKAKTKTYTGPSLFD